MCMCPITKSQNTEAEIDVTERKNRNSVISGNVFTSQ